MNQVELALLKADDFEPHLSQVFLVLPDSSTLELISVIKGPPQQSAPRAPFSLLFRGSESSPLSQGTLRLSREGFGELEIFLVPVGKDAQGFLYEAVFG